MCNSGSSKRKTDPMKRQYKPLEHTFKKKFGSDFETVKRQWSDAYKSYNPDNGLARFGSSRGLPFADRMSSLLNFGAGPLARPSFPTWATQKNDLRITYHREPSSSYKKPKAPAKRTDTKCLRTCEPNAETEKHYERIGTMECAGASSKGFL